MQPAWGLYYMHCVSFPLWLGSAIREMRAQRHRLPSEWDFFGVRFMAAYVLLDGLRGFDLCFEGADGECQAVWGVCPLYLRMAAWFARDDLMGFNASSDSGARILHGIAPCNQ
eukprot:gnl/TRDRNA2_/TRDRNA2_167628_c0_seq6.p1 gnl/TRDRNA2_/TRDRNA2_167628_c0~~gnl/TRDRNA2_/TRDRNA2_167628_c0_seq6.p1  ORF type:complete len:113 (-),score=6.07 gnl/TRDRNA2_/TRDRNA2_167628_c0_seq6:99-437(-)